MGAVAEGALDNGGEVHGIIPRAFVIPGGGEKGAKEGEKAVEGEKAGNGKGAVGTTKLGGGESTVVGGMHEVSCEARRSLKALDRDSGRVDKLS